MIEDSAVSCDFVRSSSECESAARKLGLTDVTVADDGQSGATDYPPFCYFEGGSLKFNNMGSNTGPCTASKMCLCRQNEFCTKIPCGNGEGDCDNDTQCEAALVCGQLNCPNSSITDCCTHTCHNDSDCMNQECIIDINQCRLDSYSTDWSNCSHDSPCADGEGDCDHHTDCEESLLCGRDNCARGPTGMDCCTVDGNSKIFFYLGGVAVCMLLKCFTLQAM